MSVWVSRKQIVRRLRDANWEYSSETKRVEIWKRSGSVDRMDVPKKDKFPVLHVRVMLKQAGIPPDKIEEFLNAAIKE
jgi:hypothetical protein